MLLVRYLGRSNENLEPILNLNHEPRVRCGNKYTIAKIQTDSFFKQMQKEVEKGIIMDIVLANYDCAGPDFANLIILSEPTRTTRLGASKAGAAAATSSSAALCSPFSSSSAAESISVYRIDQGACMHFKPNGEYQLNKFDRSSVSVEHAFLTLRYNLKVSVTKYLKSKEDQQMPSAGDVDSSSSAAASSSHITPSSSTSTIPIPEAVELVLKESNQEYKLQKKRVQQNRDDIARRYASTARGQDDNYSSSILMDTARFSAEDGNHTNLEAPSELFEPRYIPNEVTVGTNTKVTRLRAPIGAEHAAALLLHRITVQELLDALPKMQELFERGIDNFWKTGHIDHKTTTATGFIVPGWLDIFKVAKERLKILHALLKRIREKEISISPPSEMPSMTLNSIQMESDSLNSTPNTTPAGAHVKSARKSKRRRIGSIEAEDKADKNHHTVNSSSPAAGAPSSSSSSSSSSSLVKYFESARCIAPFIILKMNKGDARQNPRLVELRQRESPQKTGTVFINVTSDFAIGKHHKSKKQKLNKLPVHGNHAVIPLNASIAASSSANSDIESKLHDGGAGGDDDDDDGAVDDGSDAWKRSSPEVSFDAYKFSPFYPHGQLPIPGRQEEPIMSESVEGIWQGLKVILKPGKIPPEEIRNYKQFNNKSMKAFKSTGKVLYHEFQARKQQFKPESGIDTSSASPSASTSISPNHPSQSDSIVIEKLDYVAARRRIYLPAYHYVLEKRLENEITMIEQLANDYTRIVLLDYNDRDVDDDQGTIITCYGVSTLYCGEKEY